MTSYLYTVMYYDERGRLIQQKGNNELNGTDHTYTAYSFTGKPTQVKQVHTVPGKDTTSELRQYTYDHADRPLRTTYQQNNDTPITLVDNVYDELGRLKTDRRNGNAKLKTDYAYNIRSWTKSITGPLFNQTLCYQEKTEGNTPCYNGNISGKLWKSNQTVNESGYRFTYDGLNRMKNTIYGEGHNLSANANRFNEQITGYDKMGNILSLLRYGQTSAIEYGLVDNLNLTYDGNQLQSVNDGITKSVYGNGTDFKNGSSQTIEYTYDKNGNLTKDLNKNITSIQYNLLNLPSQVTFGNGNRIEYEYAANGTKLRTVHVTTGVTTTTDYCGNSIYENGVLKTLLNEAGYMSLPDKKFHFYLKDHQGNVRVVADKDGNVEETNAYYPFGGTFTSTANIQPYKYNGKELDTKNGLNWYDYGARHYDAELGRWHTIDLMAEKYYNSSPFVYCANNPIRFIDPTGLAWRQTFDEDHDGFQMPSGYAWVDEAESYNDDGTLKKGLYAQAIFFSDNGIFNAASNKNMGSSTATAYLADGTMKTFAANTLPSSEDFATVPEGVYHATVGSHKGQYTALRMSDTDKKGRIELGTSNPAHPERTYAEGINIHKPGLNNVTGMTRSGKPISAGCLLIDRNKWNTFIGLFNNKIQRGNIVSVTVSRNMASPVNVTRLPAFNFILNGSRSNFFK